MNSEPISIEIFDKREKTIATEIVEKISATKFRVAENSIWNCLLTVGTEFETRINKDSNYEIVKITKESEYLTRRFFLTGQFSEEDYRILGDEIIKQGGFWQVDFGNIATVNLPENTTLDLDEIFRIFDFHPTEIVED